MAETACKCCTVKVKRQSQLLDPDVPGTSDERQNQLLDPDVPGPQGRVTKERLAERVDRKGAHALGHSAVADVIKVVEI